MQTTDFLVIGGGIIGVAVARELLRRHPDAAVAVLEKEPACGRHASGRNSGVLHAGFYYTADSLKARFTRDGNRTLRDYCCEKGLPLNECGKLVLARSAPRLDHEVATLPVSSTHGQTNRSRRQATHPRLQHATLQVGPASEHRDSRKGSCFMYGSAAKQA